jgi:hypothetical protein
MNSIYDKVIGQLQSKFPHDPVFHPSTGQAFSMIPGVSALTAPQKQIDPEAIRRKYIDYFNMVAGAVDPTMQYDAPEAGIAGEENMSPQQMQILSSMRRK